MLLYFVVLFSTFLIQCVAWEIPSECSDGVLKDDALSNSLHNWIFLVPNIFWIALGIICLSTSEISYPWPLFALVVSCHWQPLLPYNYLFSMAWGDVCVPFLPKWLWCIPPPWRWYINPPTLIMLPMTLHILLYGLCWGLLRSFVVWWNFLIGGNGLLPWCMLSVHSGSFRRCVPPILCHSHWMWGQILLVLKCNQKSVGSVALFLRLGSLTVKQSHWFYITKYCPLLYQGILIFHRLVEWISCRFYQGVVQLIVKWHTA